MQATLTGMYASHDGVIKAIVQIGSQIHSFDISIESRLIGIHQGLVAQTDRPFIEAFAYSQPIASQITAMALRCYQGESIDVPAVLGRMGDRQQAMDDLEAFQNARKPVQLKA
jgi:hypothetical protein